MSQEHLTEAVPKGKEAKPGVDIGTQLAHERTDLAVERTFLASENTLMGWIRTALSMIGFGFTIGKLGNILQQVQVKGILGNTHTLSIRSLAYFLVILGTSALLIAAIQHWRRVQTLNEMGLRPKFSIAFVVALLLAAVGGFALTSLVLSL